MRESIEELIVLTECRLKLATIGDIYNMGAVVQTQADLIVEENKCAKNAIIKGHTVETPNA